MDELHPLNPDKVLAFLEQGKKGARRQENGNDAHCTKKRLSVRSHRSTLTERLFINVGLCWEYPDYSQTMPRRTAATKQAISFIPENKPILQVLSKEEGIIDLINGLSDDASRVRHSGSRITNLKGKRWQEFCSNGVVCRHSSLRT
jgi:hypothetical protein